MNQQDIDRLIQELERRGYTIQYNGQRQQNSGGNGLVFIAIIAIIVWGMWTIFNKPSPPLQGYEPTNSGIVVTESETVILETSTPMTYPTNMPLPTIQANPAIIPTANPVATTANPMLRALQDGEWPRPITPEQYNQCITNPNINPVCADYLGEK